MKSRYASFIVGPDTRLRRLGDVERSRLTGAANVMDTISNDNSLETRVAETIPPDAHGHAAILLVESLIHGLLARSVISAADAVEIVAVAADVKMEFADEPGETAASLQRSLTILDAIRASLDIEVPRSNT